MRYLSNRRALQVLEPLRTSRTLFVFDFDGTLAPIVARRANAVMPGTTRALFMRLASLATTAVISGRSVLDLHERLKVQPDYLIGNHGLEGLPGNAALLRRAQTLCATWRQQLEYAWCEMPHEGIEVEDKQYTLAVHYRLAPDARRARRTVVCALTQLRPVPLFVPGKKVINVLPPGAPSKGDALLHLLQRTRARQALFIGDDDTDEAVFELDDPRVITVRVGRKRTSCAQYYLRHQAEIDKVLRYLTQRSGTSTPI
ncbi:MAG: trehalose-phosphatase [Gammaproteobacteria bacterium]|nr:trehalose-phosphatase [Gammaproteobacteria bacterium]